MATLYPQEKPKSAPLSEQLVWEASKSLGEGWYVLHSVSWQSKRKGRQGDGEADFLLIHPDNGIIILEVKGGKEIRVEAGKKWVSVDRYDQSWEIKDPFGQAKDSKYALINYLKEQGVPTRKIYLSHAVVFPEAPVDRSVGPAGPREIICDKNDLEDFPSAVKRILDHWGSSANLPTGEFSRIIDLLAPTTSFKVHLKESVELAHETLIELTERQSEVLNYSRRVPKALITGSAGTGKTALALQRARRSSQEGFGTLLTCFNSLLGDYLAEEVKEVENLRVATFHQLCLAEAWKAGLEVPSDPSSEWWERVAPEILGRAAEQNGTSFDSLVVDEGQDFSSAWLDHLLGLANEPDEALFYVFADSHQDLFSRDWGLPGAGNWPELPLDLNCRNTKQIANKVAAVHDDSLPTLGASGPEPEFYQVSSSRELPARVQHLVARLIQDENLEAGRVVALSDSRRVVDSLRDRLAGEDPFVEFGGNGVVAETVGRFKGLEADAIVLALSDGILEDEDRGRVAAYVGLSRARGALYVVGSEKVKGFLKWDPAVSLP